MQPTPYSPASGLAGKLSRISARALARSRLPIALDQSIVTFTFDDFPKSAATRGAARLEREGWRATFFASGCFAGATTHHGAMYDASDLHRLTRAGHEIACHTYSHVDAGGTTAHGFAQDAARNRAYLKACGHDAPLDTFAFPYGEATPSAKRALAGQYRALRGVRPGVNRGGADRALLKSTPLDGGLTGLHAAIDAVRDATLSPGWLIFYGHDVQDIPTQWGCTPDFLDAVANAVKTSGAQVLTMSAALDKIEGKAS